MDSGPDRDIVLEHLARVRSSAGFQRAERSGALLTFLVERTLDGQSERLKEFTLGAEALGRGDSFDPRTDTIVRAEVSRLRARLKRYYETDGRNEAVRIVLPAGSYVPQFVPPQRVPEASDLEPNRGALSTPALKIGAWALAGVAIGAVAALAIARTIGFSPSGAAVSRFDVELKSNGTLGSQVGTDAILSPDGRRVVFVARDADGLAHIYTRRLDQVDQAVAVRLPGTEGARSIFISPDGRWVGFWAGGAIRKVPVDGGAPVALGTATDLLGAAWAADGFIVAPIGTDGKLWRIPERGPPAPLVDLSAERVSPVWPQAIPDTPLVLYTAISGDADNARIDVLSTADGSHTTLVRGGTFGRFVGGGYLTYVNQGTLYGVRFDPRRLSVDGPQVPLLQDVSYSRTFGYAQLDISSSGTLVYRRDAESALRVVQWLDRAGGGQPLLSAPGRYSWPRLSPDGSQLAVSVTEAGTPTIEVVTPEKGETRRFTTASADHSGLMWSPSGAFLLFGGIGGMSSISSELTSGPRPSTKNHALAVPWSVSPDGQRLAYHVMSPDTSFDIVTARIGASADGLTIGDADVFLRTPAIETSPTFSPDGRWLAYVSNETGVQEVYVRRFPDGDRKVRVSMGGGSNPRWSPTGRELLYRAIDRHVMVADYAIDGATFTAGRSRPWTPVVLADTGVLPSFDIAPDGGRIAALMPAAPPADQQSANHVTFILNFADEIARLMAK